MLTTEYQDGEVEDFFLMNVVSDKKDRLVNPNIGRFDLHAAIDMFGH